MIAYLEGRLLETSEDTCVVVTESGVGYEVHPLGQMLARLPARGEHVEFFVHTIVREDALDLYGFPSWDERQTFGVLLSISKLGPKTALALLSHFSPDDLRRVIINDDPSALTSVSGIGKKTAQHIFLELKYKLKVDAAPGKKGAAQEGTVGAKAAAVFRDALAGLTNLGYPEDEARVVLERVFADQPDLDVAAALREALKAIAANR